MVFRNFRNRLLAVLAGMVLLASLQFGFAETTTIEVPQGTGVFPTIGQIKCLEELGSGRFCAATYECSDDSGELWGDLANHNGRRAVGATSPVANQRDCVITVDGKASVRWLTGYRPEGRTGEFVGLTTSADALRPVVRTTGTTGTVDGGRSLLHYILERYDTSLAEIVEFNCGDYRRETASYANCIHSDLAGRLGDDAASVPENELTRCLVGHYEDHYCGRDDVDCKAEVETAARLSRYYDEYDPLQAFLSAGVHYGSFNRESGFPCRDVAEEHLRKVFGIEVHYCDEECDGYPWEGYRFSLSE